MREHQKLYVCLANRWQTVNPLNRVGFPCSTHDGPSVWLLRLAVKLLAQCASASSRRIKFADHAVRINLTWIQQAARKLRLINRVRVVLRFQAEPVMFLVRSAGLAGNAVQKVACVELHPGRVCEQSHPTPTDAGACCNICKAEEC